MDEEGEHEILTLIHLPYNKPIILHLNMDNSGRNGHFCFFTPSQLISFSQQNFFFVHDEFT